MAARTAGHTAERADPDRPVIVAHRGLSGTLPENTLPAFRAAVESGADGIETDIQRTADGQLVLMHDETLARTTNVDRVFPGRADDPVGSFTSAELRRLDAGGWKDPAYAGTVVPTLAELVRVLRESEVRLYAEFKDPQHYPGVEQQTVEILRHHRVLDRVKFESFSVDALRRVRRLLPDAEVGLASGRAPDDLADLGWLTSVNIGHRHVDADLVRTVGAYGVEVTVWTVDDPGHAKWFADLGVRTITTNRPDLLAA